MITVFLPTVDLLISSFYIQIFMLSIRNNNHHSEIYHDGW